MNPLAQKLADELAQSKRKIVFAESCTAGLVAATLAAIPGISRWLCGSIVTYQEPMKTAWLDVDPGLLGQHSAVSAVVTEEMLRSAMQRTTDADLGAAITGHLGPDAPRDLDGVVFISTAARDGNELTIDTIRHQLKSTDRIDRQREAAELVLEDVLLYRLP